MDENDLSVDGVEIGPEGGQTPPPPVENQSPPMIAFLELDSSGSYVIGTGFAKTLPAGGVISPDQKDPQKFARTQLVNGEFLPRPLSPLPVATPEGYTIPSCPTGTGVLITDLIGHEILAAVVTDPLNPEVSFTLPDEGVYEVEVVAPLPYLPSRTKIEVT